MMSLLRLHLQLAVAKTRLTLAFKLHLGTGHYLCRGGGGGGKRGGKDQDSCKAPPADPVNSKLPHFFIQYLRNDPPPPTHIFSDMLYKVLLKCM